MISGKSQQEEPSQSLENQDDTEESDGRASWSSGDEDGSDSPNDLEAGDENAGPDESARNEYIEAWGRIMDELRKMTDEAKDIKPRKDSFETMKNILAPHPSQLLRTTKLHFIKEIYFSNWRPTTNPSCPTW
jgi:hypothetical protein